MKKRFLTALALLTGMFLLSASIVSAQPVWVAPAPVAKTGQTTSYLGGDDGYSQKGVASPSPRFIDNGDGTVTDNLTGLMWAKDANAAETSGYDSDGKMQWNDAIYYTTYLSLGATCGAPRRDWRLPNRNELNSLIDASNSFPALPTGHPFSNVQSSYYWSSTTSATNTASAWDVHMYYGLVNTINKTYYYYVWPVRSDN
jgi:hypothetical protein